MKLRKARKPISSSVGTHLCPYDISFLGPTDHSGTSLIRNTPLLGPYSRTIPRVLWWSQGGGLFLMSEVPLYGAWGHPLGYQGMFGLRSPQSP